MQNMFKIQNSMQKHQIAYSKCVKLKENIKNEMNRKHLGD